MKKFLELVATPFGGLISTPLMISIFALYALMFHVGYTELVQPIAELYGHILPTIPYWQWLAFITIVSMLKYAFIPQKPFDPDNRELLWKLILTRIGGIFASIFIAIIINWIWL